MNNPFISVINQTLPEPQAGLLNGILFGVRAQLPPDFYEALIVTGTVHIIALSGQNISILENIIGKITLPLGRKPSILITLGTILAFVLFVGVEPTIVRAAIMGTIALFAVYFGRQKFSLLGLFVAGLTMALINPSWISNISFQLSFMASLGIIVFSSNPPKRSKYLLDEIMRELKITFNTTIAAQLATLPIILWRFERLSLVSPLTNVLIGWLITPVMVLGLLTSIMGLIYLPLGQVVAWVAWLPLTMTVKTIEITAKLPFASLKF